MYLSFNFTLSQTLIRCVLGKQELNIEEKKKGKDRRVY